METRKVQEVGGGTYTVSLPVEWAKKHGVQAGTTAYLSTHRDGSLVVRWNEPGESDLAQTDIDVTDSSPAVARGLLRAAYLEGFERIRLNNPDGLTADQRRAIENCARSLTGVEITEESDQHVVVRGLLKAGEVSIRQSTLQLQYATLSMYAASLEYLTGATTDSEQVRTRESEVDRTVGLITRHFNRSLQDLAELDRLGISRPELFEYYVTAQQLQDVANEAMNITQAVDDAPALPESLVTVVAAIGEDTKAVLETATGAVIEEPSAKAATSALETCEEITAAASELDLSNRDITPEAAGTARTVLDGIVRSASHGQQIAELSLQHSLRSQ